MKDRDVLDLIGDWVACNRAEIAVVELANLPEQFRATLRTALGRTQTGYGGTPSAALRHAYSELGYRRTAHSTLELIEPLIGSGRRDDALIELERIIATGPAA